MATGLSSKVNDWQIMVNPRVAGLVYGFIGVTCFALTLPATRLAALEFNPLFVAFGRAIVAGLLAAVLLWITKQPIPAKKHWLTIGWVSLGVVIGFPLLSSYAMKTLPASQGAIVTGLIPLGTAMFGAYRAGQRLPWLFWISALIGSSAVVLYSLASGGWQIRWEHWILLLAVVITSISYTEGALLGHQIGSWQVICWTLVFSLPVLIVPVAWSLAEQGSTGLTASPQAWFAFAYLSVVSMFLAFFAWYRGLMLGGIPQVSQVQLLQPFMTIVFSALFLQEPLTLGLVLTALFVVLCVAVGRYASVK